MAYVLGFIATDGNIYKKPKTNSEVLSIAIQKQDCWLLSRITNVLKVDNPVKSLNNKYCHISISLHGMLEAFSKWGITERKSLTLKFPKNLPKVMVSHFIRGVFDGDGTITFKYDRKRQRFTQSVRIVTASFEFAQDLYKILLSKGIDTSLRVEDRTSSGRSTLYAVCVLATGYEAFYKFIYKKDTISLTRKKLLFKQMLKHRDKYTGGIFPGFRKAKIKKTLTKAYLIKQYKVKHLSSPKIAKLTGVDKSTICKYLRKYNLYD